MEKLIHFPPVVQESQTQSGFIPELNLLYVVGVNDIWFWILGSSDHWIQYAELPDRVFKICYSGYPGLIVVTKSQIVHLELQVDSSSVMVPKILYSESINGGSVTDALYCSGHILLAFNDGSIFEFNPFYKRTFFGFPLSALTKRTSSSPIRLLRYDPASNYLCTLLENERICLYKLNDDSLELLDTVENITFAAQTAMGSSPDWTLVGLDFLPYGLSPLPILVATARNGTRFFACVENDTIRPSLIRFSSQSELMVSSTAIVGSTFVQIASPNQVVLTTRCSSPQRVYLEVCEMMKTCFPAIEHVYALPELQIDRKCSQHQCELRFW